MNTYLLLRNNKESGPFKFEELVKQGLKQYDLVWIEGKSAAWRYPGEINELKPYAPAVNEQPFDRFYRKNDKSAEISESVVAQPVAEAKQKPRIRIKAEWRRVEPETVTAEIVAKLPIVEPKPTVNATRVASPSPSWQNSWLNWQEEKTAVHAASQSNVTSVATASEPGNIDAPVLETKFSQSLNDIKERYAATVLNAKNKVGEWQKFKSLAIIVLLAIPIMCFGVWLGHKWTANNEAGTVVYKKTVAGVTKDEKPAAAQPVSDNTTDENPDQPKQQPQAAPGKELIPAFGDNQKPAANQKKLSKQNPAESATQQVKKSQQSTPEKVAEVHTKKQAPIVQKISRGPAASQSPGEQQSRYAFTVPANADPGARTKTVNPNLLNGTNRSVAIANNAKVSAADGVDTRNVPKQDAVFSHVVNRQGIDAYVSVDADQPYTQNVQNFKLSVQNLADIPLDLVVIDVEYFDASNRFKNGQTIHIKNIPAGETIPVKIPDNAAATRIKYKVSLVSAEQKGVYLIAE